MGERLGAELGGAAAKLARARARARQIAKGAETGSLGGGVGPHDKWRALTEVGARTRSPPVRRWVREGGGGFLGVPLDPSNARGRTLAARCRPTARHVAHKRRQPGPPKSGALPPTKERAWRGGWRRLRNRGAPAWEVPPHPIRRGTPVGRRPPPPFWPARCRPRQAWAPTDRENMAEEAGEADKKEK